MNANIRNLSKWLNEEQTAPIDRQALARVLAMAEQPAQQTCNCRWEGDVQVQQCTLHEAHVDAIHEWAERAKTAEAKLKAQPAQHPLTDEQIWKFWWSRPEVPEGEDDSMEAEFVAAVRAVLAAYGIKENT